MLNLAGTPPSWIRHVFGNELIRAGVPILEKRVVGEVASPIVGVMDFADGQRVEFERRWYYLAVNCRRPFPCEPASALNARWREQVRVEGFAGGKDVSAKGVSGWHVDTLAGLKALTRALCDVHGPCVLQHRTDLLKSDDQVIRNWPMSLRFWRGILWSATLITPDGSGIGRRQSWPVVALDDGSYWLPYTAHHLRRWVAQLRHVIDLRDVREDFSNDVRCNSRGAYVAAVTTSEHYGNQPTCVNIQATREIFYFDYANAPAVLPNGEDGWRKIKRSMHNDLNNFERLAFLR